MSFKKNEHAESAKMSDSIDGEVEIEMTVSEDSKTITIVLKSTIEMDTHDLIMALESYLTDLTRAATQQEEISHLH